MNKIQIEKELRDFTGRPFISRSEVQNFLGVSSQTSVTRYVHGLEKVSGRYYVGDVAERIMVLAK